VIVPPTKSPLTKRVSLHYSRLTLRFDLPPLPNISARTNVLL
jgi:hypothetical protein